MKAALTLTMLVNCLLVFFLLTHHTAFAARFINITPIQEINTSPASFDGKEVTLRGITKDPTRIPVIDLKAYTLADESDELTILTDADLPSMGMEITVRVRVENLAIIQGEAIGTTVIELKRYE